VLRSITDEIMYELMELSGQEYVDIYAQVAKDRAKAEKAANAANKSGDSSVGDDDPGSADRPEHPTAPAA
jgi:1-acyl-sn-glycerol-3-phosphate acyltransferase